MRKTLKVLGILFGALLLLIVVVALALPFIVDPNDFKPRIEAAVEEASGRELEIAGDIDLSVFPWLGVQLGAVRLGNADGFGEAPFATVEGVQVRVKLLPLLTGNIEVGRIVVQQPYVRLERRADGTTNWDDLAGEQPAEPAQDAGGAGEPAPDFSVDGIEIRAAQIVYADAVADMTAELADFHLETGELSLPADFPLAMRGRINVSNPELAGSFEFEGRVLADPEQVRYEAGDGRLRLDMAGDALPVSPLAGSAEWQRLAANLTADTAVVEGLVLDALGLEAEVSVEAAAVTTAPRASGTVAFHSEDLARPAAALAALLPDGLQLDGPAAGQIAFSYDQAAGTAALSAAEVSALGGTVKVSGEASGLPDAVRAEGELALRAEDLAVTARQLGSLLPENVALSGPAAITTRFTLDQPAGTASVPAFAADVLGVELEAEAAVRGLNDEQPVAEGVVRVGAFSPGQLMVRLGTELPATRDAEVLDHAAFAARFRATPDSMLLRDIAAELDQTVLSGQLEVADFATQALRFDLALDEIDVDRYLPPADEQAAEQAGAETSLDEIEVPAELVRGLDIVGNIAIGKLKAFDFNSSEVRIGIAAQNDKLRVHPAEAKFYGGGYSGDIRIDASGKVPVVALDEHVQRVQLAPMVSDILDVNNISGTAKIDIAATARGATLGAMRKTLNGSFAIDVQDGAIEGFNLWESIREAYATLKGRAYQRGNAPERTEFAELAATGRINKGVVHNNDLVAKLPFLRVAGSGTVDIAAATLDYTLEATVLKSPELRGDIEELTGTAIPVRLTGPVLDPKVRPDVKTVLERKAKEALERKEQELRDKAKDKIEEEQERLEDKLKDKLKDLFG